MRNRTGYWIGLVTLAAALTMPLLTTGCGGPHYYRGYDPYYGDYHVWNPAEMGYYQRWEVETHRPHEDFRKRNHEEQKEYYTWRHQHENDHDHDHDHK